jgi:glycerol kinase
LAETVPDNGGVYLVSAFTGLGAPHWDMYARGAILGITRGVTRAHIARAALEGIAYQVYDLVHTMSLDTGRPVESLWVDGGAAVSDFLLQFQADLLGCGIHRPQMVETTAAGAAYLAGLAVGFWDSPAALQQNRQLDRSFTPTMAPADVRALLNKWEQAVSRAKSWETQ